MRQDTPWFVQIGNTLYIECEEIALIQIEFRICNIVIRL